MLTTRWIALTKSHPEYRMAEEGISELKSLS